MLVVRQSPDWAGLAHDHRAGQAIDPARYLPPRHVPDFPADIPTLIGRWNAVSPVDFFTCRVRLKAIAEATLVATGARILAWHEAARVAPEGAAALFFTDDDDWFAPDLADRLGRVPAEGADTLVFPFVRLGAPSCTFVNPAAIPRACFGPMARFPQRYHTNNYALMPRLHTPENLAAMQDHFDACEHGDRRGFTDRHAGEIVGATNKSPCAASFLRTRLNAPEGFSATITAHARELASHPIPDALDWLRAPIRSTVALLEEIGCNR